MPRKTTPSFTAEFPLDVDARQERVLGVRFDVGRQIGNAFIGEARKRLDALRASDEFQALRKQPKSPERTAGFKALNECFGFTEAALQSWGKQFTRSWLGEHVDSSTTQKLASRAFSNAQQYAFGKRGRPRMKGKNQFHSIEGKSNATGIIWRDQTVRWGKDLTLTPILDLRDPWTEHALSSRIKYVRLIRRKMGGRDRYYVQLICEGFPLRQKNHRLGVGVVGADLGPKNIAVVAPEMDVEFFVPFCAELQSQAKLIARLQRKADRKLRAANPENYLRDGRIKPGPKRWVVSKNLRKLYDRVAELHRVQAAHRKSLHGRLVNDILSLGDVVKVEKLSYKGWQKRWGKSVGFRAPGAFMDRLRRSAERANAQVDEFSAWSTALSQVCVCGRRKKKPLSLRVHECPCGIRAHRDLFSAFLACFVQDDVLQVDRAQDAWSGADRLPKTVWREVQPRERDSVPNRLAWETAEWSSVNSAGGTTTVPQTAPRSHAGRDNRTEAQRVPQAPTGEVQHVPRIPRL